MVSFSNIDIRGLFIKKVLRILRLHTKHAQFCFRCSCHLNYFNHNFKTMHMRKNKNETKQKRIWTSELNGRILELNGFLDPFICFMQPSMGTLNSPSSRVVKDSTPSRRRILRYINFGILFLDMVNLHLIIFEAWWILNERAIYCFIIFFSLKWILT